jgi:predicted nucleic acid-binding protein
VAGPRGRPSLARDVYPLDQLVAPAEIVLDTSIVLEALFPNQPHRELCISFFERAAQAGTVLWFNEFLELELAEASFSLALRERWGPRGAGTRRFDGRARSRASRLLAQVDGAWEELLSANNYGRTTLAETAHRARVITAEYGVKVADAVHAATAELVAVSDFATLDSGFGNIPWLRIHTDRGRLATCRRYRTRR